MNQQEQISKINKKRPVFKFCASVLKTDLGAFTLVELIVVVTILAILSTIGFVSYSSYLIGVRDTNRISNLKALSDGLELYRTKFSLPLPEDSVEVKANGVTIAYQGYAGANVLESIEFSNGGKDPKDDIYYSYYLTRDKKYFQLMGFLEEEDNLQANLFRQMQAIDYSVRYPIVYGRKLGILTNETNTPIQEIDSIVLAKKIELNTTNSGTLYKAHYEDGRIFSFSGYILNDKLHTLSNPSTYGARKDCPDGFIGVWGDSQFNQPGFCIAQYEMTYKDGSGTPDSPIQNSTYWNTYTYDSTKEIVSKKGDYPVVELTISEAIDACTSMGNGYHLITNSEWMAITRSIELTKENWSSGEVGDGFLYNGVSNNAMGCGAGTTKSIFPELTRERATKTGMWSNNSCNDKRQLRLLNGAVIRDLAGNVWEFVNKANTLDGSNYYNLPESNTKFSDTDSSSWRDWNYGDISFDERYNYGPIIALNSINGVGSVFDLDGASDNIFERGGSADDNYAGIFSLSLRAWDSLGYKAPSVGFRCAYIK